jgi:hypothetical protein
MTTLLAINMKNKYAVLLFLLFIVSLPVFSQENLQEQRQPAQRSGAAYVPHVLLHSPSFFSKTSYQLKDGTPVKYRDVLSNIVVAPGNESLVRQEKIWRSAAYATAGLFAASFVTASVYIIGDFPRADTMLPVCFLTGAFSFLANTLAGQTSRIKLQSAVDRYNLYIIGILVSNQL